MRGLLILSEEIIPLRILGIDPGLKATGYGFVESALTPSQSIEILPKGLYRNNQCTVNKGPRQSKGLKCTGYLFANPNQHKIKLIETGTIEPKQKDLIQNRVHKIYEILGKLIDQHRPQVLVLEKLYAHFKHPITASILGHARGVVCLLCAEKRVELVEHSPKRIRKAVTGNGNASKVQVKRMVAHRLNIDEKKLTLDASDALALALGYIYMKGSTQKL